MMKLMGAGVAVAAAAVLGAGCGAGGSSGPVGRAADATTKASTARFSVFETQSSSSGESSTIQGVGVMNRAAEASDIRFGPAGSMTPYEFEEIAHGGVIYFHDPTQALPPGKTWLRLTPAELGKLSGTAANSGYDPNSFLDKLSTSGVAWKTSGTQTVDGVPTTRYHAVVDLQKELAKHSGDLTKAQRTIKASAYGSATFLYDVWVGKPDGRIRKLTLRMGGASATHVVVTYLFSDYGAPLTVAAPPAARTVGLAQVTAASGGAN